MTTRTGAHAVGRAPGSCPDRTDWPRARTVRALRPLRRPPGTARRPGAGRSAGTAARPARDRRAGRAHRGLADGPAGLARPGVAAGRARLPADGPRQRPGSSRRRAASTASAPRAGTAAGTCSSSSTCPQRQARERVRGGLAFLGYGQLADATWVAPWPSPEVDGLLAADGRPGRGVHRAAPAGRRQGRLAWSGGPGTSTRWRRRTSTGWRPHARIVGDGSPPDDRARRSRPAASSCTSGASSCSPTRLPRELLPADWPGDRAAEFFTTSAERLRPGGGPVRRLLPGRLGADAAAGVAAREVVVDHPGRLHQRVRRGGADEHEAARASARGHRGRLRRGRRHVGERLPAPAGARSGANDHSSADSPSGQLRPRPARCAIAAAILARLRTMPASASSRASSSGAEGARPRGSRSRRTPRGTPAACAGS